MSGDTVEIGGWRLVFSNGEPKAVYPVHESHEWSMTLSLVRSHDRVVVIGAGEGLVQTAACIAARSPRRLSEGVVVG